MIKFRQIVIVLIVLVSCNNLNAQNYLEITDNDSTETNEERLDLITEFMSGINFDTCADIGSGNLEIILKIANTFYNKTFVLEDIDSSLCNRANMFRQIENHNLRQVDTNNLSIHIGDTISTRLPDHQFDLVIMSSLIHEINVVDEFLADIRRILKPSGTIIISDAFYEYPPGLHNGCTNRFLTNQEMENIIKHQNLIVLKDWRRIGITAKNNGPYISRIIQCSFN